MNIEQPNAGLFGREVIRLVDSATSTPQTPQAHPPGRLSGNARSDEVRPLDGDARSIRTLLLALKGGPLFILGLLVVVLWITTEGHVFMTFGNVGNVLEQSAGVCIIAIGQ